jgi:uncharacterized protein YcnI
MRSMTYRTRTPVAPLARPLLGTLALSAVLAGSVLAHAVVYPGEAPTRAYQKYVLRVPNELGSPTTRVQLVFPDGVRVISFDEVAGWTLETTIVDGGATFTGATWTGTLPAGRFVEFAFIGVNPSEPTTLRWDAVQTYADGTVVEWTGPPDSATPASVTSVVGPAAAVGSGEGDGSRAMMLAIGAVVASLLSLGLSLRPRGS